MLMHAVEDQDPKRIRELIIEGMMLGQRISLFNGIMPETVW